MKSMPPNATYAYIGALVDEFARAGLRHICICPGSRSTPLAISFFRDQRFRLWTHLDERSAGFFALGLAKVARSPVALLCTSGTAAANFMPAIVEARQAHVPLLVLTADRPPELRDCGAPQAIDQIRFYGTQVKWAVELATPGATDALLRYARTIACRALAKAQEAPAGPVHLNIPLREPLVPVEAPDEIPATVSEEALFGRAHGEPHAVVRNQGPQKLSDTMISLLARELAGMPRGIILCGPLDEPDVAAPMTSLAQTLGYPILADPLSGLRCGPNDQTMIVDSYDALLRDERFAATMEPQVIVRFGAMPTSKPVLLYLQRHAACRQILIDSGIGWQDPTGLIDTTVQASPTLLCAAIEEAHALWAQSNTPARSTPVMWGQTWLTANRIARVALTAALEEMEEPFEGRIFAELAEIVPEGATLYVGNSMPVRDLDTYFAKSKRAIRILGNRGANGIDGVVSSALGAAAGSDSPVVLVIGDISFYHDMNGLLAAKRHSLNLTIVVLNNDGGGIFSFLPQAQLPDDEFTLLFSTPHGLDFVHASALYDAQHTRSTTMVEVSQAIRKGINVGGLHIIEVVTQRQSNVTLHRRCWPAVSAALATLSLGET